MSEWKEELTMVGVPSPLHIDMETLWYLSNIPIRNVMLEMIWRNPTIGHDLEELLQSGRTPTIGNDLEEPYVYIYICVCVCVYCNRNYILMR